MAMAFTPEMDYPFPRYYGACGRDNLPTMTSNPMTKLYYLFARFAAFEYVGPGLNVLSRLSPWSVR